MRSALLRTSAVASWDLNRNASVSGGPWWDKLQLVPRCSRKWARQAKAYPTRVPICLDCGDKLVENRPRVPC